MRTLPAAAGLLSLGAALLLPPAVLGAPAESDPAPQRPLWELGVGLAGVHLPDYRGADVSHDYLLPLPWLIYRGRWLRADREGARAVLLESTDTELNLSAHASAPARSRDNPARRGMADLPATVELGPRIGHRLWRAADGSAELEAQAPLRAVMTLQRSPRWVGTVFTPTLDLSLPKRVEGWNLGVQVGASWGSRGLHQHLYGVDAAQAEATRPAWSARAGYGGWHALAAASRRLHPDLWAGLFLRVDRLDGTAFADSPLVRRHSAVSGGFALAWVLARSSEEARSGE